MFALYILRRQNYLTPSFPLFAPKPICCGSQWSGITVKNTLSWFRAQIPLNHVTFCTYRAIQHWFSTLQSLSHTEDISEQSQASIRNHLKAISPTQPLDLRWQGTSENHFTTFTSPWFQILSKLFYHLKASISA